MATRTSIASDEVNEREASSTTPLLKRGRDDVGSTNAGFEERSIQHIEVDWDDEDNRNNPRNWAPWFKWSTVFLVSFIEFLT